MTRTPAEGEQSNFGRESDADGLEAGEDATVLTLGELITFNGVNVGQTWVTAGEQSNGFRVTLVLPVESRDTMVLPLKPSCISGGGCFDPFRHRFCIAGLESSMSLVPILDEELPPLAKVGPKASY